MTTSTEAPTVSAVASIASHLAISAVERDTGLSKDVLRVWERRYGFPVPERDANGERLYPLPQVERLRSIKRLMDAGHRPGKLLALSETDIDSLVSRQNRPQRGNETGNLQRDVIDMVRQHDSIGLRHGLTLCLMRQGLQAFLIDTVAPLNRAITEAWMRGEVEVFEERAYAEMLQALLRAAMVASPGRGAAFASHTREPQVLLATLPNEVNALGLLMTEAVLVPEGAHCISLGTQVPIPEIGAAAAAFSADIVILTFSASFSSKQAVASLESIRAVIPQHTAIWVGGELIRRLRRDLPGITPTGALADVLAALRQWRAANAASVSVS